jgi:hypothetical protein
VQRSQTQLVCFFFLVLMCSYNCTFSLFNHGREFGCYSEGANLLHNRIEIRDIEECVALCLRKPGKNSCFKSLKKSLNFLPYNRKHFCLLASSFRENKGNQAPLKKYARLRLRDVNSPTRRVGESFFNYGYLREFEAKIGTARNVV